MFRPLRFAWTATAAVLGCLLVSGSWAAPRTRFVEAQLPDWKVVRGKQQCSLYNVRGKKFAVELSGSSGYPTLFLMHYLPYKDRGTQSLHIVLMPSETSYEKEALAAHAGYITGLPAEFLSSLSRSDRLSVYAGERKLDYEFGAASEGVEALRACHDKLQQSWGVDPIALRAMASLPKPIDRHAWFEGLEMPGTRGRVPSGQTVVRGGDTVVRIVVRPDGRPESCVTVASSGSASQDIQSCAAILAKAKYEPARDRAGAPVSATIADVVRWAVL